MGHLQAAAYAEMVKDEGYDLSLVLQAHLSSNHFPPINPVFVPVAKEAIEWANVGDWERTIEMPNDITLSVAEIVEQLHLDAFLDDEED